MVLSLRMEKDAVRTMDVAWRRLGKHTSRAKFMRAAIGDFLIRAGETEAGKHIIGEVVSPAETNTEASDVEQQEKPSAPSA